MEQTNLAPTPQPASVKQSIVATPAPHTGLWILSLVITAILFGGIGYFIPKSELIPKVMEKDTAMIVPQDARDAVDWPFAALAEPGDKVGDFTVIKIEEYIPPTKSYPLPLISADFAGETTISGPFSFDDFNGLCFNIESGNTPEFREFVRNRNYAPTVCIRDSYNNFSFKLVTGRDIPVFNAEYPYLRMGDWGKATIVIKDYKMMRVPKGGTGDSADLVKVLN